METTESGHLVTTGTVTLTTEEEELAEPENEYLEPLFYPDAIRNRDLAAIQAHLSQYPKSLYAEIPYYFDPFIIAAQQPDPAALCLLLDHWALHPLHGEPEPNLRHCGGHEDDPDYFGRGDTLLNVACAAGALETARYLLDKEEEAEQQQQQQPPPSPARVHVRSAGGTTLILEAAESLVACASGEMNNWQGRVRAEPVTPERIERSEALVHFLLDRGASARDTEDDSLGYWDTDAGLPNPNSGDEKVVVATVLSLAIARAGPALLQRLLDAGADALVTTSDSIHGRNWQCIFQKTGKTNKVTLLHLAAFYGNYQGIQVLLEHYTQKCGLEMADVVAWRDQYGRLPIHWAVAGRPGAEIPVESGTDSDRIANNGNSNGNGTMAALLRILTNSGTPHLTNARDQYGETPLHYAITSNLITKRPALTAAHFLCKDLAGDINAANDAGNTSLHIAARNLSDAPAAEFLISRCGANVRIRNNKGQTPLHEAARGNSTSSMIDPVEELTREQDVMLAVLCASGVERELALDKNWNALMDEEDLEGKTPRQIAQETRAVWLHEEVEREREIDWLIERRRWGGRG